ncbi:unnamed protein product [Oppiella nova]|uniref:Uncharacterized protein n=1 Tax=Oppiella nova TaxID=334625 RepID=A0A7R9LWK0_9ACAR|nr:unnamed protein product [Oppiella nova]CAG2167674.1 unnamed protein product [Oppiella nova]
MIHIDHVLLAITHDPDLYIYYDDTGFWYWAWIFIIIPLIACIGIGMCVRRRRILSHRSPQILIANPQYASPGQFQPPYDPPPKYFQTTNGVQQQAKW